MCPASAVPVPVPVPAARSSLKSWIFTILMNRARTRAGKEWRQTPFSALGAEDQEPLLDPALFDAKRRS